MGWVLCGGVGLLVLWLVGKAGGKGVKMEAKYRGRCLTCGGTVSPGQVIFWRKGQGVRHADCKTARTAAVQELVQTTLAKLEKAGGPVARKNALAKALEQKLTPEERRSLIIEASRIEVGAILDKVDGLKSPAAKRRHIEAALATIRADEVPDDLQAEQITWLEDALRGLG